MEMININRCRWSNEDVNLLIYHDVEWGVPITDSQKLFEKLSLNIFMAGLSRKTILKRRDALYKAFNDFSVDKVCNFNELDVNNLLSNNEIIRNKQKIKAIIHNAQICKNIDLYELTWRPFNYTTLDHLHNDKRAVNKEEISLFIAPYVDFFKNKGFKRVGPNTLYAYYQDIGVINDHDINCFRHDVIMSRTNIKNFNSRIRLRKH
ncbi:DNA-3-methyladenine glycosylase I [Apilactobacillus bombintestini]|uniref:DNA-3-methyladenine glycosylase I n=1 Tax=Apilactobacillus bombintestini TaxID=2419772 RepID=A0A387ATX0_9LACO|nr:DNA-3-methyladenine glycosylase I [Apilactobacillus bombintestini]AYF92789.1 DNA-3-methyladenine glycosylase I [Apilactobacillus bombintestini]